MCFQEVRGNMSTLNRKQYLLSKVSNETSEDENWNFYNEKYIGRGFTANVTFQKEGPVKGGHTAI